MTSSRRLAPSKPGDLRRGRAGGGTAAVQTRAASATRSFVTARSLAELDPQGWLKLVGFVRGHAAACCAARTRAGCAEMTPSAYEHTPLGVHPESSRHLPP